MYGKKKKYPYETKDELRVFEKIDHIIKTIGQGANVAAVAFHSKYSSKFEVTEQEIREAAEKYPNWVLIKDDKVYTDKEIIEKYK